MATTATTEIAVPQVRSGLSYEEYVATAIDLRVAVGAAVGTRNWVLGGLADEVCIAYGEDRIGRYARDIGLNVNTLKGYRATYRAWDEIVGRPTFSVAQQLAAQPDRAELVAADPDMTVREARAIVQERKPPTVTVEPPDPNAPTVDAEIIDEPGAPEGQSCSIPPPGITSDIPCYLNSVSELLHPEVLAELTDRDKDNLAELLKGALSCLT